MFEQLKVAVQEAEKYAEKKSNEKITDDHYTNILRIFGFLLFGLGCRKMEPR